MSKFKSKADLESSVFADRAFRERLEGDDSVLLASRRAGSAEETSEDPSLEEEEAKAEEAEEESDEAENELDGITADESAEEPEPAGDQLSRRERRHELRLLRQAQSKQIDRALTKVEESAEAARAELEKVTAAAHEELEEKARILRADLASEAEELNALIDRSVQDAEAARAEAETVMAAAAKTLIEAEERARKTSARLGRAIAHVDRRLNQIVEAQRRAVSIQPGPRSVESSKTGAQDAEQSDDRRTSRKAPRAKRNS
jgi:hypothetical protein